MDSAFGSIATLVRGRARAWIACSVLLAGCSSVPRPSAGDAPVGRPSLAEIFLLPPMNGVAPRVDSLSANGEWALVRWSPLVIGADGKRKLDSDRGDLRVLSTSAGARDGAGVLLRDVLERIAGTPAQEAEAPKGRGRGQRDSTTAWSSRGERLAVAWGNEILLVDPPTGGGDWKATVIYRDPPAKPKPAEGEADKNEKTGEGEKKDADEKAGDEVAAQEGELARWPERLGRVRSLRFSDDDRQLEVTADKELFLFLLDDATAFPLALDSAQWPTQRLSASVGDVQLDRARDLAFSRSTSLGKVDKPPVNEGDAATKEDAYVLDLRTGRLVVLEGRAAMHGVEDTDLSPDGRFVVASEVDHSEDPAPTLIPDYLTERVTTITGRRELADAPRPPRKLWLWNTSDGARTALELPGETTYSLYSIGWAPQETPQAKAKYAFRRMSSDWRTLETWVWNEGSLELVLTDFDERWIGGPTISARWSRDGEHIVFASESLAKSTTPGRCQLFELDPATRSVAQLTQVEGEVSSFSICDDGGVVFTASREDPGRRCIGRAELVASTREQLGHREWRAAYVDAPSGWNDSLDIAAERDCVVFAHEELGVPAELWCASCSGEHPPRQLTHTIPEAYADFDWIRPVELDVARKNGPQIHSHVYLPRSSSLAHPDRARPCVVFIHGAGYLQNVSESMSEYAVNMLFHSRLASMGYVVLDVDYRGSAGYGSRFRSDVQYNLGKYELDDIDLAVDELARRGVIDAKRVGCYGGSYGGFLTLMALFTQGDRWACGAALRSVTDWRTYHPGYTQPRLGRPSIDADAYVRSSPIDHAEGLNKPLLILHGMVDTNVFAQDSIRLVEKLIDLGKDFEAMLYPSQGHGFEDGNHWLDEYKRIEHFMVEHLGAP